MKKVLSLIIVLCSSFFVHTEETNLHFMVYHIDPVGEGCLKNNVGITRNDLITDLITYIEENTGVKLTIDVPFTNKNRIDSKIQLQKKISYYRQTDKVPDLITGIPLDELFPLMELKKVSAKDIERYAPNIYHSYTKKFWRTREEKGDVYRIPVKIDTLFDQGGIWLIRGEPETDFETMAGTAFVEFLSNTDRTILTPEEYKKIGGYQNLPTEEKYVSGFLSLILHVTHLQKIMGVSPFQNNKFFMAGGAGNLQITNVFNSKFAADMEALAKKNVGGIYYGNLTRYYTNDDWIAIRIPLDVRFSLYLPPNRNFEFEQRLNGKDFQIFNEIRLWNEMFPSRYKFVYCYIPAQSEDWKETLQLIDKMQEPDFGDVLRYGIPEVDFTYTGNNQVKLLDNRYYYGPSKVFSALVGTPQRIFEIFPDTVAHSYNEYMKQPTKSLLYDIDYNDLRKEVVRKLFPENIPLQEYFDKELKWRTDYLEGMQYENEAAIISEEIEKQIIRFLRYY